MRKAFTLIELLVVIAIIAILAAILFPVFAQAKAAAKKTQALSNSKQETLGYIMYIGDYDGTYYEHAQGMSTGTEGPNSLIWNGYIYPYTKNVQIANDPMALPPVAGPYNGYSFTGKNFVDVDYRQLALGLNANFTSQLDYACSIDFSATTPSCSVFFSESNIQFPAQSLFFASGSQRQPNQTGAGYWVWPIHAINADNGISDRHNGFTIVGFLDGHSKALKATTLLVSDQEQEIDPNSSGQCVNYDVANVYWDWSAPLPTDSPLCEGHGIR